MRHTDAGSIRDPAVGQLVVVKGHGRAEVLQAVQNDPEQPNYGRCLVKYADNGSTYWARAELLRRVWEGNKRVLVCETTPEYRSAVISCTESTDVCLEVGCHEGLTTSMIKARSRSVVGVDKSEVTVAAARARFPAVRFEVVDAFDTKALKELSPDKDGRFDKIFVDIGGIAELHTVMAVVGLYFKTFKKARLVVKSVFLKQVLENAEVFAM